MSDASLPVRRNTTLSRRTFIHSAGGTVLAPIAACLAGYAGGRGIDTGTSVIPSNTRFRRQGFTIPCFSYTGQKDLETSLRDAAETGANSVVLDYHLLLAGGHNGSCVEALFPLDRLGEEVTVAKSMGFHTVVKPVLIVGGYKDPNHTNWQRIAPADPGAWFKSYTAQLTELVRRPEAGKIDALLLGNELHSMTTNPDYKLRWAKVISIIRSLFPSQIGYNARELTGPWESSREYLHVTFVDSLDFIGISAYPRLSKKLDADADDYRRGWRKSAHGEDLVKQLTDFLAGRRKDVYLTELGSPATRGGAYFFKPSEIVSYDLDQHAAFFDASLDVLASIERLRGVYIYNWHANAGQELGFAPDAGAGAYLWNVYGKPAQNVIRRKFLK